MKMRPLRRRCRDGAGGVSARAAGDAPAAAACRPSTRTAVGFEPAAPAAAQGVTATALAVERYWEAWREAATDAELAFGWWVAATVVDRERAATGYFAAFEREEKAALAYQDAWQAWRPGHPRDQAGIAAVS
jgi:hypothetical protein